VEDESLNYFYAFHTSNGAVCWNITNAYNEKHDSMRFYLHIVDPSSGKEIKTVHLIPAVNTFESSDAISGFSQMRFIGDLVWEAGKQGLTARDPRTGEITISDSTLSSKYPELKAGIGASEFYWWGNSIKITTKDGFSYYLLPEFSALLSEEAFEKERNQSDKSAFVKTTEYSFSEGIRRQLYRISGRASPYTRDLSFSNSMIKYFEDDKSYFRRIYKEYEITPLMKERFFINGMVLASDSNQVIIAYQKEASETSPIVIEGIFRDSTKNWRNETAEVNCLKDAVKNGYRDYASIKNNLLVIKQYQQCCFGLNILNGQLVWTYLPDY
jgi:hypothetical protein